MFIVKFVKFVKATPLGGPDGIEHVAIYPASSVHVSWEKDRRQVVQLGDAPDPTVEYTVGERLDTQYDVAYVMNEKGKTVETIR